MHAGYDQGESSAITPFQVVSARADNVVDILIVDDDGLNLMALKAMLITHYNLKCEEAQDGVIAVQKVK